MSWLKDNLIMILAGLVVILALGWTISGYRASAKYSKLQVDYTTALDDAQNGFDANQTNQAAIKKLREANAALVAQQKADQTAAATAAARQVQFAAKIEAALSENARLREALAQENPNVRTYLDAGMPCELAYSLWPDKTSACKN